MKTLPFFLILLASVALWTAATADGQTPGVPNSLPVVTDNRYGSSTYRQVTSPPNFWTNADPLQLALGSGQHYAIVSGTGMLVYPTSTAFYTANPPPAANSIFAGDSTNGAYFIGGHQETWDGAPGRLSLQSITGDDIVIAHSTGNGGIAIVGWSSTGAQGLKAVQDTHFNSAAETIYRSGVTANTDKPAFEIDVRNGLAPLMEAYGSNSSTFWLDYYCGIHASHLADSAAQNDSIYISTTTGQPAYKNSAGVSGPLGGGASPLAVVNYASMVRGETGGGSTNLDGIATVSLPNYYCILVRVTGLGLCGYVLEPTTDPVDGSVEVTPLDYNSSTNLRKWRRRL